MGRWFWTLTLLLLLAAPGPAEAQRVAPRGVSKVPPGVMVKRGGKGLPHRYALPVVKHAGKLYYRTWRVTSPEGYKRISDKSNGFRWFQGDGQYGEAFYLFRSKVAAKKFIKAETTRGAKQRNVLVEVLLPKEKFDQVAKSEVPSAADWGMQRAAKTPSHQSLRDLRLNSHLLFGRWAKSPHVAEPIYDPLNGAQQLAVVQRGQPSILNEAVLKLHEPKAKAPARAASPKK